jgi:hypothetical protein
MTKHKLGLAALVLALGLVAAPGAQAASSPLRLHVRSALPAVTT